MTDEPDAPAHPAPAAPAAEGAQAAPPACNTADEADELKAELARRVQQPASKLTFLEPLPPKLLRIICETFDENSKDGQMVCRLEAYTRSVARRHNLSLEPPSLPEGYGRYGSADVVEKRVETFVHDLELGDSMLELIHSLDHQLQIEVIEQFDVEGTRDGNVQSRLLSFVRGVWLRHLAVAREVGELIKDCPETLQADIIKHFDPSGTKDGNLSARLHSFATRRWRITQKKDTEWGQKMRSAHKLNAFVRYWKLDSWALSVLQALPPYVQDEVLKGFDGNSTRDGYVDGRFLAYTRGKWAKYLELDEDCSYAVKQLTQEGQVMCMTEFDPTTTRDGNVSARLKGFLWKVESKLNDGTYWENYDKYDRRSGSWSVQDNQSWQKSYGSWKPAKKSTGYTIYDDDGKGYKAAESVMRDAIIKFVARWNLDLAVGAYLERLKDPDLVARVLEEFDPSGTQDGNVMFRLKSFVRLLCSRRKREELDLHREAEVCGRSRTEKWQKKPHS